MLISISTEVTPATWKKMTPAQRRSYLKKYPNSRYVLKANLSAKKPVTHNTGASTSANKATIINIIKKSGLSGLMEALNGIDISQLSAADPRIPKEGDDEFNPKKVWKDALANLYEAVDTLVDSSNDH